MLRDSLAKLRFIRLIDTVLNVRRITGPMPHSALMLVVTLSCRSQEGVVVVVVERMAEQELVSSLCDTQTPEAIKLRSQLEGSWELVSYQVHARKPFKFTRMPLGAKPSGMLIYTRDGHMSVQMQKPSTMRFLGASPHGGFFWEKTRAASHYMAYGGTFAVGRLASDEQDAANPTWAIEHAVHHSLYPNWIGTRQIRLCALDGNVLTLRPNALPKIMVRRVLY